MFGMRMKDYYKSGQKHCYLPSYIRQTITDDKNEHACRFVLGHFIREAILGPGGWISFILRMYTNGHVCYGSSGHIIE
jgi:hypothetical protein